jgi:hypothetical protein
MMKNLKDRASFLLEKLSSEIEDFLVLRKKCYKEKGKWNCDKKFQLGSNANRRILINAGSLLVKFGIIKGEFSVAANSQNGVNLLRDCKGFPSEVHGKLTAGYNMLTSLKGFPKRVDGDINLTGNKLTNLAGLPKELKGELIVIDNPLQNLKGIPADYKGKLILSGTKIKNLKDLPEGVTKASVYGCREIETIHHVVGRNLEIGSYEAPSKKINVRIVECEVKCYEPNINPNRFFSKLVVELVKNRIDPKEYKYWPKGFLNKEVSKSANTIYKFDL